MSIVLPNWNGSSLLEKNLPSVIAAAPDSEIIVADDASDDNSCLMLKQKFPTIVIVENKKQQGFAGNINSGVAKANGEIVVLLNTDVSPEKDFLEYLIPHFSDPNVSAVGCLEKSHEPTGIVLRGRGLARWEKGFFIHTRGEVNSHTTAWVTGGSSAYRRTVWNTLGGMDVLYNPFYWEDIDLSYQMLKSGYTILFEPKSIVHHFHEQGKIKTSYTIDQVKRIAFRNQFMFLWKNISDIKIWRDYCIWMPVRLIQALFSRDMNMIYGYCMMITKCFDIQKSRKKASRYWRRSDSETLPS